MANTTWNPADLANTTLSGTNNLTISATSNAGGVRTIQAWTTGKFYFEYTCTTITGNHVIGVANPAAVLTSVANTAVGAAIINVSGQIVINNTTILATLGSITGGTVVCIALDLTNQQIWMRLGAAGNWNGSGTANPVTNTGGFSIAALTTTAQAIFGLFASTLASSPNITANFGDTSFTGTVPAGFTAGYPTRVGTIWCFGDSFDLYATTTDAIQTYWDNGGTVTNNSIVSGRFAGGRAFNIGNGVTTLAKSSNSNDAIHHITLAFEQTTTLTGTSIILALTLGDVASAQCTVGFRSDGAILLQSGATGGATLATYTGAVTVINQWFVFEIEVVINNTTGSFTVRKNGNTSNDFALGSLNTRAGSANNYANRLTINQGAGGAGVQVFDDLLWRSDSSAVPWIGDVRCYTRMPASDAAVQFSKNMTSYVATTPPPSLSTSVGSDVSTYVQLSVPFDGAISAVAFNVTGAGWTGNVKCTLFSNSVGNSPGTVLQSATAPIVNPIAGTNTFTFSPTVAVTKGTLLWVGFCTSAATNNISVGATNSGRFSSTITYATFPVANPTIANTNGWVANVTISSIASNATLVNEVQEDGSVSYVTDTVAGHADLYTVASIGITPASTIATTVRSFMQKADAGSRSAAVELKSGTTTVAGPATPAQTTWAWAYRTDQVDPATGLAWTSSAVNSLQIGQTIVT